MKITSPKEFFGFNIGDDRCLARFDKILEYFSIIESKSDRMKMVDMGATTEGNRFVQVIISAKENLESLDEIKKNNLLVSDPRGLTEEQMEKLAENGKAICVQSMCIHSHEVAGTQMAVKLAYELLASDNERVRRILDNVVFVLVPCFNPDGQLKVTDFYYSSIGTPYEGTVALPFKYHKYAAHDNNRDAVFGNLIESGYVNKILYDEWKPQCYQDFHQQYNEGSRMFVGYHCNPVDTTISPLNVRESMQYGTHMTCELERHGCAGAATSSHYDGRIKNAIQHSNANSHNIVGLLAEVAMANTASPLYQTPEMIVGEAGDPIDNNAASFEMPHPWKGGSWTLSDAVKYVYHAAFGLLDVMAKNRYEVISNRMQKALEQTKRGEEADVKAYVIPADQADQSALAQAVNMLIVQDIELYRVEKDFVCDGRMCGAGSIVIPAAQPNYSAVVNLLGHDGSIKNVYKDLGYEEQNNICDTMGLCVFDLSEMPRADLKRIREYAPIPEKVGQAVGYIIPVKNNNSWGIVNALASKGIAVSRIMDGDHDFYTEADASIINELQAKYPVSVKAVGEKPEKLSAMRGARAGMYMTNCQGDACEGWARLLFDRYGFDCEEIRDADLLGGKLDELDVLIIPDSEYKRISIGCEVQFDAAKYCERRRPYTKMEESHIDFFPEPYKFGLEGEPMRKIAEFVKNGGRLLSIGKSTDYIWRALNMPLKNWSKDVPDASKSASVLNVKVNTENYLCYGMDKNARIVYSGEPLLGIGDPENIGVFDAPIRYSESKPHYFAGKINEKLFASKPAIITAKLGKGEVVLYGFQPNNRAQTCAGFKLLFNALCIYE